MLSDAERRVLLLYCVSHPAARCPRCHEDITASQVGMDLIGAARDFCPACRTDLTDVLRWHLLECATIGGVLGERIESSRLLRKLSEERKTRSELLAAESAALVARVLARRTT